MQAFREWNPGYTLGQGTVGDAAEALLTATPGAVRYCWLFDGRGEVWLPAGYRTQEGDGARLPAAYRPDPLAPEVRDALTTLRAALATADGAIPEGVRAPLTAIMERWQQPAAFVGNVDGEVWRLLESGIAPERWLDGAPGAALRWLAARTETLGWSTKQEGSWEPVGVGDQLIVRADAPLRLRGSLRYWWIEDLRPGRPAGGGGPPPALPQGHGRWLRARVRRLSPAPAHLVTPTSAPLGRRVQTGTTG